MASNDVITLDGVSKSYKLGRIRVRALEEVTLTIARGDFIAIAGPSGVESCSSFIAAGSSGNAAGGD